MKTSHMILFALIAVLATVASAQTVNNNGTGTNNGYYYTLYTSSGTATMTFPSGSSGHAPAVKTSAAGPPTEA